MCPSLQPGTHLPGAAPGTCGAGMRGEPSGFSLLLPSNQCARYDPLTPSPRSGAQRGASIIISAGTAAQSARLGGGGGAERSWEGGRNLTTSRKRPRCQHRPPPAVPAPQPALPPGGCPRSAAGGSSSRAAPRMGQMRGQLNWMEEPEGTERVLSASGLP